MEDAAAAVGNAPPVEDFSGPYDTLGAQLVLAPDPEPDTSEEESSDDDEAEEEAEDMEVENNVHIADNADLQDRHPSMLDIYTNLTSDPVSSLSTRRRIFQAWSYWVAFCQAQNPPRPLLQREPYVGLGLYGSTTFQTDDPSMDRIDDGLIGEFFQWVESAYAPLHSDRIKMFKTWMNHHAMAEVRHHGIFRIRDGPV
jgi:hypothetical protein